ncbi:Aminoglycoside phosphotransferase [Niveomyces insectorum RCEF 264]|uniref:Aminoglycoside phosphotransferase n=1 Tax=Niveomyces insectorum RCEF 264 TaxID=1081102 RepID=A0A167TGP3_9HYPO|nr:Aminoglycoside phosphotransferase [Niveomyces insectorum RCEF 264]
MDSDAAPPPPKGTSDDDHWPPTAEQLDAAKKSFISAIDPDAVCRLASRHHPTARPCRVFSETASGSFNACFFVEFDDAQHTKWNVRVAIMPALDDAWAKVQSEVATMRYIRQKTTIPVARVHAYGRGEDLCRPDAPTPNAAHSCVYAVFDYLPGHSIDISALFSDTRERKTHLYAQIIDILAQLRGLEFPVSGSLYPPSSSSPSSSSEPTIGNLLCIEHNELRKMTRWRSTHRSGIFRTPAEYALYQYRTMSAAYQVPIDRCAEIWAQMEEYALHDVKARVVDWILDTTSGDGADAGGECFVLSHTDLRWYNILVDDHLNVQGVIDWERSGTVPQRLFMPPNWLAGQSPSSVGSQTYRKAYAEFYAVLTSMVDELAAAAAQADQDQQDASSALPPNVYQKLADEWGADLPDRPVLPLAAILRHHHHLVQSYFFCIFRKSMQLPYVLPRDFLPEFFVLDKKNGGPLSRAVEQRLDRTKRYQQYLQDNGLFVERRLPPAVLEWLKKRAKMHADNLEEYRRKKDPFYEPLCELTAESVFQDSMQMWNYAE